MLSLGQRGHRRCRGPQGHCPRPSPVSPAPLALLTSACCLPSGCVRPSKLPSSTRPWQAPPPGPTPTHPISPLGGLARWRDSKHRLVESHGVSVSGPCSERGSGLSGRVEGASRWAARSPEPGRGGLFAARCRVVEGVCRGLVLTTVLSAPATDGWSFWRRPCGTLPGAREVPLRWPIRRPRAPRRRRSRAPHPAGAGPRPRCRPPAGCFRALPTSAVCPVSSPPTWLSWRPHGGGCGVYGQDWQKPAASALPTRLPAKGRCRSLTPPCSDRPPGCLF